MTQRRQQSKLSRWRRGVGLAFAALLVGAALVAQIERAGAQTGTSQCVANAFAGGTPDAITIPALPCGLGTNLLLLTSSGPNATTFPTLQPLGSPALPIKRSDLTPVLAGDIGPAGSISLLSATGTAWLLMNPRVFTFSGTAPITAPQFISSATSFVFNGSNIPAPQGQFYMNRSGTSTTQGTSWGANVSIGTNSDTTTQAINGVYDELLVQGHYGGGMSGGRVGLQSILLYDIPGTMQNVTDNLVGLATVTQARAPSGGQAAGFGVNTFGLGSLFGSNPFCSIGDNAPYWNSCTGEEIDVNIHTGSSAAQLVGEQIVLTSTHHTKAVNHNEAMVLSAQQGATAGWDVGYGVGANNAQWPMDPNGYLFQALMGNNDPSVSANVAGGIDLVQANFIGTGPVGGFFAFRTTGAWIDGAGRGDFGYGLIDGTSGGLTIGSQQQTLSGTPTVAAGGSGYSNTDVVADIYGNLFTTNVGTGGVVTSVNVQKRGWVTTVPGNPVGTTSLARHGVGFGSGLTLTESWAGAGVVTLGKGGDQVKLPTVTTGGPVASLCLDASNNIVKKTTTGPCI